ncbi:MAG: ankyrin repeat domain-containing protein [Amoebophilaceae bacterium]|nr:ankyrin repeat domain-containing protein [Amoebophilaceae bacterium]
MGCLLLATQLIYGCNSSNSMQMDTNHQTAMSSSAGTATDASVVQLDPSVVRQAICLIDEHKYQELEGILNSNPDLIHAQNLNYTTKIPRILLAFGKNTYNSLLEYAVMRGYPEVLSLILNKAAEARCLDKQLHAIDSYGQTLLHVAIASKQLNVVSLKLLLEHVEDISSLVNQ